MVNIGDRTNTFCYSDSSSSSKWINLASVSSLTILGFLQAYLPHGHDFYHSSFDAGVQHYDNKYFVCEDIWISGKDIILHISSAPDDHISVCLY